MEGKNDKKSDILLAKLELLLKKQEQIAEETDRLRREIIEFHLEPDVDEFVPEISPQLEPETFEIENQIKLFTDKVAPASPQKEATIPTADNASGKRNFEKLIGENLINKIGIAITVLGVAIGAKYSIDNNLISPLTRIILGYVMGIGLMGFAIKLKQNYHNYSAVLVGGAIAILYFITYAAYSFYYLFPVVPAFILMVIFTSFAVVAALHYDKQIIAHIGLAGAYGVPFLLSEGSGNVTVLFAYMSVINIGILIIAFKKYWKPLYYVTFFLSWLIYLTWYFGAFRVQLHFSIASIFLAAFFLTFYLVFLAYKLVKKEKFEIKDIAFVLINSFIFYGVGYSLLYEYDHQNQWQGLFTLANAVIHFISAFYIYRLKLTDKSLFYLLIGMMITFITITIPVQLEGSQITLLWIVEATFLFWLARSKKIGTLEKMSYPLMVLSVLSLMVDWSQYSQDVWNISMHIIPFFNSYFLTGLITLVGFTLIYIINSKQNGDISEMKKNHFQNIFSTIIQVVIILLSYYTFLQELKSYWDIQYQASVTTSDDGGTFYNQDINNFEQLCTLGYSILFLSVLAWLNVKKIQNYIAAYIILIFLALIIFLSITQGLAELASLRSSYLYGGSPAVFDKSVMHLLIRYIILLILAIGLYSMYKLISQDFMINKPMLLKSFNIYLCIILLIILSSELVVWMEIYRNTESSKLAMSILWGVFGLAAMIYGFRKNMKHIRLFAIGLFSVTLIKLFFYDISDMDTIAKTVIFIILGILLLITSFLYNKFNTITTDNEEKS